MEELLRYLKTRTLGLLPFEMFQDDRAISGYIGWRVDVPVTLFVDDVFEKPTWLYSFYLAVPRYTINWMRMQCYFAYLNDEARSELMVPKPRTTVMQVKVDDVPVLTSRNWPRVYHTQQGALVMVQDTWLDFDSNELGALWTHFCDTYKK